MVEVRVPLVDSTRSARASDTPALGMQPIIAILDGTVGFLGIDRGNSEMERPCQGCAVIADKWGILFIQPL